MPIDRDLIQSQRENGSVIESAAIVLQGATLDSPVNISSNALIYGSSAIGKFTYINAYTTVYSQTYLGKFCSIGRNCHLGIASHPSHFLSTHSFQYSSEKFSHYPGYDRIQNATWDEHSETHVGHDVWIGNGSQIKAGLTIGNGSIIAAGAVVTKDVLPYAIVGGVPAKIIRYRFPENIIQELLDLQWWEIEIQHLQNIPYENIEEAIAHLKLIKQNNISSSKSTPQLIES